jgi:hypothetical protein
VGTPCARASAIFVLVAFSFATIQQAIEILSVDIKCALCCRWLARVDGSYPASNGLVAAARSGTPIRFK